MKGGQRYSATGNQVGGEEEEEEEEEEDFSSPSSLTSSPLEVLEACESTLASFESPTLPALDVLVFAVMKNANPYYMMCDVSARSTYVECAWLCPSTNGFSTGAR